MEDDGREKKMTMIDNDVHDYGGLEHLLLVHSIQYAAAAPAC